MKAFLFILVFVYPDGKMDISHTFVPKCPTIQEVNEIMRPLVESKEISNWGGSCTSAFKPLEA